MAKEYKGSYTQGGPTSKKMNYGGGFTDGAGDGDITPKDAMMQMAKGGGLMGFMEGGSVLDPMMKMTYGGTKNKNK